MATDLSFLVYTNDLSILFIIFYFYIYYYLLFSVFFPYAKFKLLTECLCHFSQRGLFFGTTLFPYISSESHCKAYNYRLI